MAVKSRRLRRVDGKAGALVNLLLSVCRYQTDSILLRELGVPRDTSNMGTPLSS